jgi:hypothetical protein
MKTKNYVFAMALALFIFMGNIAKSQEHEVTYEDGTKLYYTMIDTNTDQMHRIHFNIFTLLEVSYFRPDKKFLVSAVADWYNNWYGVQGYYFFNQHSKEKVISAQAKEQYAGANTMKVYPITIYTEKRIYYGIHGGLMMVGSPGVFGAPLSPEISVGIARIKAWGTKYMIKDPATTGKRSLYTIIAQRIGTINLDLMFYPVKPASTTNSAGEVTTPAYSPIGERLYLKGFIPLLSHRDAGLFGMIGVQNGMSGPAPLIGFGFSGGWK